MDTQIKVGKKVRIGSLYKKMKKPVKLLKKAVGCIWRRLASITAGASASASAPVQLEEQELSFITFVLNVKRRNWRRVVLSLLRNMKGVRFQMNKAGKVEVNGVGDPDRLLRRIGRSCSVSLEWIQFGQCSTYLFMPPEPSKKDPAPAVAAAVQEKPITQNNLPQYLPSYAPYGNGFQPSYAGYAPYGNGFPQSLPSYAPYGNGFQSYSDGYYPQSQLQQRPFPFWQ